jgi:hypothetical protein
MSRHPLRAIPRFVLVSLLFSAVGLAQEPDNQAFSSSAGGFRVEKRAAWMMRGREAPPGASAAALRLRAQRQKISMRAQREAAAARAGSAPRAAGSPDWVALGPAPLVSDRNFYGCVSGRATSVAIDSTDATGNTVYVGGAFGGVWKSINAASTPASGVIWSPVTDQQASLATGAISVKADGSVVLVGTGEPNSSLDSYYGVGILRSTDGGAHWTLTPAADGGTHPFAGLGVAKFAWSTAAGQANTVVAAMGVTAKGFDDGAITGNSNRGLYRSSNGGQSWSYQALPDGAPISATDVVYNASAGKFVAVVRDHGLYTSADGTNWTRPANQPSALTASCSAAANCPIYRGQLAVVPGRDEMYFWFIDVDSNGDVVDGGIWRSINGGAWIAISEAGLTNCGDPDGCGASQGYFNLTLAAAPDGTGATNVYAGAANLFKCKLQSSQTACTTIDANLPNSWLNLTHVFGTCSSKASVHPAQHGMDFAVIGGKAVMYFANDGGIYRALDGYLGLQIGSCNTAGDNQFDNLNGTIGSMTQFVSLALDPNNQDTILGGAQGNGSPATTSATSNSPWTTVNGGDGAYSAINPASPTQWFTANTDVSIQVCDSGIDCDANAFVPVVTNGTVGGDAGPFYTPYILDPQNASELLVGTCRVWRGSATGAAFSTLSPNFDMLSNTTCTGDEFNLVRGIAAGGAKQGGFSNVVYATTEGSGPNCTGSCGGPFGGSVWVTTNAATTQMANVTGNINPLNYTISSVAMDDSDTTGKTAYVGLMGFVGTGNAHIWKTTNAGQSWTAFGDTTSGLPDAPVNALLVDSSAGIVYAGTDVGVFSSPIPSAAWTEVGPDAQPGAAGYLPNVAVTAVRLFNSGGTKKLRVSTYGRGIWEFALAQAPDFSNTISDSTQTVFPPQNAIFHGTLTALNGYTSAVNLSCAGTPPATCAPNPAQLTPTANGAAYTITAGGAVGDYSFRAHAVGTDANTITHDAAVTLHVVDFGLTNPNPGTVTAPQGGTSDATVFQVTAAGAFSGSVTLTCQGAVINAGAVCNFSPAAIVNPTAGSPVGVGLTVSVPAGIAVNSYAVTIQATTAGAPAAKTKPFTLTVTAPPDFIWNGGGSHTVLAGQTTLAYNFTVTPTGSSTFTSTVTFACSNLPDPTVGCVFNPNQIAAGSGGTTVSLTITTKGPNSGVGGATRHRADGRVPWWLLALPAVGMVLVGVQTKRLSRKVRLATVLALGMLLALWAACGGVAGGGSPPPPLPGSITISPSNPSVMVGANQNFTANNGAGTVTWTVNEGGGGAIVSTGANTATYTAPASGTTPASFTITASDATKSGHTTVSIPAVGVSVSPSTLVSLYANEAGNAWPVSATQQQFTATVQNATDQNITWAVTGGNANGTIDTSGLYTAPAIVPNPANVTVTATAQADPSKPGTGTISLLTPTILGTFPNITVNATEGGVSHSQTVTLTVQ